MSEKPVRLQRLKVTFDEKLEARIRTLAQNSNRTFQQQVCWMIKQGLRQTAIEEQAAELLLAGWPLIHTSSVPPPAPDNVVPFGPRPA